MIEWVKNIIYLFIKKNNLREYWWFPEIKFVVLADTKEKKTVPGDPETV